MAEINIAPSIVAPHLQMFKRISREGLLNGDIDTVGSSYLNGAPDSSVLPNSHPPPLQDEASGETQKSRTVPKVNDVQSDQSHHHSNNKASSQPTSPAFQRQAANSLEIARQFKRPQNVDDELLDMVCIGFGPASLAIAIALADTYAAHASVSPRLPKVLFLEKQEAFAWHAGMQLPEAKMQISFLKDLATPRDPTSPFSFINYLHRHGRLHQFINLSTFLPSRMEYEDYMRWCAGHFEDSVIYGQNVVKVDPLAKDSNGKVAGFKVTYQDAKTGKQVGQATARHVVVAAGGRPVIPAEFAKFTTGTWPKVQHSSQYATTMKRLEELVCQQVLHTTQSEALACEKKLSDVGLGPKNHRFVVIGNGQSAAEIFNDLWSRFPEAEVVLVIKGASLRPSDDSPFVNEIFDPDRVDRIYEQDPEERKKALTLDRGTNYGVVRLELLEHIYEKLYLQRLQEPDEKKWRCRILTNRTVVSADLAADEQSLQLKLAPTNDLVAGREIKEPLDTLQSTLVFTATGYTRNAHEQMLHSTRDLLQRDGRVDGYPVSRNYKVQYDPAKVEQSSGIWLQGCNERTHGLSDTLLSILAIRGGEMVHSIFGDDIQGQDQA